MPYRSARKSDILSAVGPVLVNFGVNMRRDFALVGERGRRVCMENICAAYEQVNGNEDPDRSYFLEDVERTVYDVPVVALGLACTCAVRAALLNARRAHRSAACLQHRNLFAVLGVRSLVRRASSHAGLRPAALRCTFFLFLCTTCASLRFRSSPRRSSTGLQLGAITLAAVRRPLPSTAPRSRVDQGVPRPRDFHGATLDVPDRPRRREKKRGLATDDHDVVLCEAARRVLLPDGRPAAADANACDADRELGWRGMQNRLVRQSSHRTICGHLSKTVRSGALSSSAWRTAASIASTVSTGGVLEQGLGAS